ncbi:MAG: heme exporter protein CcmB [Hyphomicrobiales bacterium]|nr:heme exporter protein CcmB [Hyphomicrobiales bacterium]MDE2115515.1 heme exporter protein CcmB [Hyphomicrobiales bacterium]
MLAALAALFVRELRLAGRVGGGAAMGVVFFLTLVTLVPFAVGPDLQLLARIGPAILWIAALLATLLGLDRLFQGDADDGSLDLLRMSDAPLELVVLVKCLAHWTATSLPLVLATPLFGVMMNLDGTALVGVTLTLLVGTPALTLLAAIGAALTAGLRRGGLLMAILILPFTIPVLIFGVAAADAFSGGNVPFHVPMLVLVGLLMLSVAGAPFAAAAGLRLGSDS